MQKGCDKCNGKLPNSSESVARILAYYLETPASKRFKTRGKASFLLTRLEIATPALWFHRGEKVYSQIGIHGDLLDCKDYVVSRTNTVFSVSWVHTLSY